MKLYDLLRSNPAEGFVFKMNQPRTVVVIDNVAEYAREMHPDRDKRTLMEVATNVVSPWPRAFYEFSFQDERTGLRARRGVALNQNKGDGGDFEQTVYVVDVLYRNRDPVEFIFYGSVYRAVSPDGKIVGVGSVDPHGAPEPVSLEEFVVAAWPADLAMTFAHCRNVAAVDNHTPPKVAAKRREAGKPVGVTYKTLVIDPMKEVLRAEGGIEKNGLKKALHICRGHFATYTADKPLFGKVTGTIWKPMHVRGDKKRGEVKKDYLVKAPADE